MSWPLTCQKIKHNTPNIASMILLEVLGNTIAVYINLRT